MCLIKSNLKRQLRDFSREMREERKEEDKKENCFKTWRMSLQIMQKWEIETNNQQWLSLNPYQISSSLTKCFYNSSRNLLADEMIVNTSQ